ncbi:MAG: hypothetical protein KF764_13810 [Labilithrix sp.]|nr:hypothetical protein [Labilithrix sp.]
MPIQGAERPRRAVVVVLVAAASLAGLGGCSSCGESKPQPESDPPATATSGERAFRTSWDGGRRHPFRRRGPTPHYLTGEDAAAPLAPPQPQ